jgi:hypothetical protein
VVDTSVRPPAAPPQSDVSTRKPRRRWLWWLIAALSVIVIGTVSAGGTLVANYQPFLPGYKQYGPPAVVSEPPMRVPWLGLPPNLRIFRVPAIQDLTFTYRFSIWNHGPVPITVKRIGLTESDQGGSGTIITPIAVYPNVYAYGHKWLPVQPFELAPRQMAGVEMQVTITDCDLYGTWNGVPIEFEMYGIDRHVVAPTNVQIELIGPQPGCE